MIELQVNEDGVLSFHGPAVLSSQQFPVGDGQILIAPFWSNVDSSNNLGSVYFRQTTDADILARASEDIQDNFFDQEFFSASWVFITTWSQVTYSTSAPVSIQH